MNEADMCYKINHITSYDKTSQITWSQSASSPKAPRMKAPRGSSRWILPTSSTKRVWASRSHRYILYPIRQQPQTLSSDHPRCPFRRALLSSISKTLWNQSLHHRQSRKRTWRCRRTSSLGYNHRIIVRISLDPTVLSYHHGPHPGSQTLVYRFQYPSASIKQRCIIVDRIKWPFWW